MIKLKQKTNRGDTLVEMIFYVALFAMLSIVVINSIIVMMKSFKTVEIQKEIIQAGGIMERISREIREANKIGALNSPSDLEINTKDSTGASEILGFVFSGSNINLLQNSNNLGNLNSPNIAVTSLSFTQISTAEGSAIRIQLSVSSKDDPQSIVYNYNDTIVLRGNY
jgi:type II secretory pathway pseudopilin PulG